MSPSETRAPISPASLKDAGPRADAPQVHRSAGDFSLVYSQWMPSLTRYCRRILKSDADAEDAAQNAMLKAMDALASGPPPDRLPPWLHRIARNEAITLMRRRRPAVVLDEVGDCASGPGLEEVAATRVRLAELLSDVQALPDRQREALVLRELDGLSHRAIADHLAISESAAQQAVLDARQSLQAFEAGRSLQCDSVQSWLSAHEHARLRTRGVRAHLRACHDCTAFSTGLRRRPGQLALLLPGGAGGLLARLAALFGGGGGKALVAAGVVATAGGAVVVVHEERAAPPQVPAHVVRQVPVASSARPAPEVVKVVAPTLRRVVRSVPASVRSARGGHVRATVVRRSVTPSVAHHAPARAQTSVPAAAQPAASAHVRPHKDPAPTHTAATSSPPPAAPAPAAAPSSPASTATAPVTQTAAAVTQAVADTAKPVVETVQNTVKQVVETTTSTLDGVLGRTGKGTGAG